MFLPLEDLHAFRLHESAECPALLLPFGPEVWHNMCFDTRINELQLLSCLCGWEDPLRRALQRSLQPKKR